MNWTIRRTLIVSVAMLFVTAISVAEASADWRLRGGRCRGARVYRHTCCTNDGYRNQGQYAGHDHTNGYGSSQLMTNGQTWSSSQANQPGTTGEFRVDSNVVDQKQTQPFPAPTDNLHQNHGDSTLPIDKAK